MFFIPHLILELLLEKVTDSDIRGPRDTMKIQNLLPKLYCFVGKPNKPAMEYEWSLLD